MAGIEVHPSGLDNSLLVKAYTIGACFDLPARASALNVIQYNGEYGCNFCEQPGNSFRTERGGTSHIFPYQQSEPKGPIRTHQNQKDYVKKAVEEQSVVISIRYMYVLIIRVIICGNHHIYRTIICR